MIAATIGRVVILMLSAEQAAQINRRRTSGASIHERIVADDWPIGAQAHIGNEVKEGDEFPMIVVQTWGSTPGSAVNGQVLLDGNDMFWATSVTEGEQAGQWRWPVRA